MTDDLHQLAAAYALDALEDEERRQFEQHLARCPECDREVRGFRAAASAWAGALAEAPPADLRERVLARVADTPQDRAAPVRPRRAGWAPWLAAAALVAVLAGLGGVLLAGVADERDRAEELAAVLAAPDAVTVELGEGTAAAGMVRVVWSAQADGAVVVGAGLDRPVEGMAYELWALTDAGPRSAGRFLPDRDGEVAARLALPGAPDDGWGVTVEPAAGSPAPTGEVLYLGA